MASPVVLILGAGQNIGAGVARAFAAKGYKVARVSRSANQQKADSEYVEIQGDLLKPAGISDIFSKLKDTIGLPSVVVYNASAAGVPTDKSDPFSLSLDKVENDLAINVTSVFAAAHEATLAFKQLPPTASKTFIYTGNRTNIDPIPPLLSLGIGKSATAHMMNFASKAYEKQGFKWYYADERKSDGGPVYNAIDGDEHGKFYLSLAEKSSQGPWLATFVKGQGYVDFSE